MDWQWILESTGPRHSVLAPSPAGARRQRPPSEYHPQFFVDALRGLLASLGVERLAAAGSSFGCLLAARLALQQPDRFRALCLVASAGLGHDVNPLVVGEA